jgi:hypothetical protein
MKKIKIISLLLIMVMSASLFAGCNMLLGPVSAEKVYNTYEEIVDKYTTKDGSEIVAEQSLFNANQVFYITYKDLSNFTTEVDVRPNSIFNVFATDAGYPQTLYSTLNFFNHYKESLNVSSSNWDSDKLKNIYLALLDFDEAINAFQTQKRAIENKTIVYDAQSENPYSNNTIIIFNEFKSSFDNLIEKAINFVKLFERAYVEDFLSVDDFLNQSEVRFYEIRRVTYTANLYLAEASYNYYVKHFNGFDAQLADDTLFNNMVNIKNTIADANFLDLDLIDESTTSYYRLTRAHEQQVIAQSSFYINAINQASELKNSVSQDDINMYNDFVQAIDSTTANYLNYSSFAVELINKIVD